MEVVGGGGLGAGASSSLRGIPLLTSVDETVDGRVSAGFVKVWMEEMLRASSRLDQPQHRWSIALRAREWTVGP